MTNQGVLATFFILCNCFVFSLSDHSQELDTETDQFHVQTNNIIVTAEKQPSAPPLADDDTFILFQIDRGIRSYYFEDVNDVLSYEDDTLPYALAEKLEQHNNKNIIIRVIKENLKKVKGYLEREKEKKKPSTFGYMLKVVVALFANLSAIALFIIIAAGVVIYVCIPFRMKVSVTRHYVKVCCFLQIQLPAPRTCPQSQHSIYMY